MKILRNIGIFALCAALLLLSGCSAKVAQTPDQTPAQTQAQQGTQTEQTALPAASQTVDSSSFEDAAVITLSGSAAAVDGAAIAEYDYTWHADPTEAHDDVKDSPAEYYTGTAPAEGETIYIAHDIVYFPELDESGFTKQTYDGETEWTYSFSAEGYEDWLFGTLPVLGSDLPAQMMHSEAEAYANPVLHINAGGTYVLEGEWNGQIAVDVGDEESVTIILNGADVTCTVAPAFIVYSAYECSSDEVTGESDVDTSAAGARIVIADGSENTFSGSNVFRILKTKYKDDGVTQKKSHKYDAAFYSCVSMEIDGTDGVLNIYSAYEGLDNELHLTVNGGRINIYADDDGLNVNEDYVSVFTLNGGEMNIFGGLGTEGDAIDSNGYIVINGGTLLAVANPGADNGLDSESGTIVNGGNVVAVGSNMGGSSRVVYIDGELQYGDAGGFGGMQGGFGGGQFPGEPPEGFGDGERPERPEGGMQGQNGGRPDWGGQNGGQPGQPPEGAPEPPDGETGATPPSESEIPGQN